VGKIKLKKSMKKNKLGKIIFLGGGLWVDFWGEKLWEKNKFKKSMKKIIRKKIGGFWGAGIFGVGKFEGKLGVKNNENK
jgi:hypothetical protein